MAKLDATGTLAQTRGRQGGVVVSSNQSGSYVRAWFMPRNPKTPEQLAWQRNWSEWGRGWAALTAGQRALWQTESGSSTWTRTDWFGQPYQPTGLNLWMMVCAMRTALGLAISSTPPTGTPPASGLTLSMNLTGVDPVNLGHTCVLSLSQPVTTAWVYIQVETAFLVSANGSARNKPYRPLLSAPFGAVTSIDATAAAQAAVGWIYAETRCWYRYRGLSAGLLPSPWQEGYASPGI